MNCDFTQENKVPARLLGVCLGEDVVVLASYTLVEPPLFVKLHHAVAMAAA